MLTATASHRLAYSAYGHQSPESGLLSLLGFNGERWDSVTGHYLLGNGYRGFNPVLMRFNGPDSLSPFDEGGLNCYAYCSGDPINRRDPTGHISFFGLKPSWRGIKKYFGFEKATGLTAQAKANKNTKYGQRNLNEIHANAKRIGALELEVENKITLGIPSNNTDNAANLKNSFSGKLAAYKKAKENLAIQNKIARERKKAGRSTPTSLLEDIKYETLSDQITATPEIAVRTMPLNYSQYQDDILVSITKNRTKIRSDFLY